MKKPFKPDIIIITGASSGIGAAVAVRLARSGRHLTLAARRQDRLQKVADEVVALGGEALVVPADVRNQDDIQRTVQATLDRWGRIDALFNNAGLGHDNVLVKVKSDDIRDEIHVNLIAIIECAQAVLPTMLAQKSGHIVNVASMGGLVAIPGSSVYCATKFGVNGFSDALRRELRGSGIYVSVFCPGNTPTGISPQLQAVAEGRPDAPHIPGLLSLDVVADQAAHLIDHPQLRLIFPPGWRLLAFLAFVFPGLADRLVYSFLPKDK